GTEINLRDIPFDDAKTFALLSRGETVGVFQMEGSGMTRYIKELQPSSLGDVAAMIALYRPGPMEHIGAFIDAKHGRSRAKYPHPDLTEILEETYGVIVYQDQVLHIARTFAGYSLGQADVVRKAMGKKIPEIMAQEREGFIRGAVAKGYTRDVADEIFALIEPFAGYAFNKAHSVSYGVISYWTAYLKANHTTEYMTALLNSYIGSTERVAGAVLECRRLKIPVLGPDINRGHAEFSIEATAEGTEAIRFGMAAVKNVSAAAVEQVLEAREREGPFESIEHMCRAADMSGLKRLPLESLIKAGAFDAFGDRGALLEVVERILGLAQSEANLRNSDQSSMFELLGESMSTPLVTIVLPDVVTPAQEKEAWERELLGMSLSGAQLLMKAINAEGSESIVFRSQIEPEMANKKVALVGQVSSASQRQTRDNKPFIIATVNLMDGPIDVFVWQELLEETRGLWQEGTLVTVVGTVRVRDDQISINCSAAAQYSPQEEATGGEDEAPEAVEANVAVVGSDAGGPPELHAAAALPTGPMPRSKGVATNGALAPRADDAPRSMRRLNLRIRETGQVEADQILLDDVKRILLEFRGDDEVSLEIATDGRIVTLEWPPVQVDACAELEQRLNDVLGEAGRISVETPE
ncbi:MAG: DNA polymerase III subunit alpha, partial [Chloroflexi bacterium]|nr:DNA polymerase III subunit alpha [Chloroflexota bacterium]